MSAPHARASRHPGRGARRGLMGYRARHPIRAQRSPDSLVGSRPRRIARDGGKAAATSVICQAGEFPRSLVVEPDLAAALAGARDVLIVVPSHAFRAVLGEIAPYPDAGHAAGLGDQGSRARYRAAASPGCAGGARIGTRRRGAVRSHFRARSRCGIAHGHDHRLAGR